MKTPYEKHIYRPFNIKRFKPENIIDIDISYANDSCRALDIMTLRVDMMRGGCAWSAMFLIGEKDDIIIKQLWAKIKGTSVGGKLFGIIFGEEDDEQ